MGDQTPEDKLSYVKNVQKTEGVIFIGDGVNDSPSLQQADVAITTSISSQIDSSKGSRTAHFVHYLYSLQSRQLLHKCSFTVVDPLAATAFIRNA